MNEEQLKEYDEIYDFINDNISDWEKLVTDGQFKIKTNQKKLQFVHVEEFLKKFNLKITDISYTDYYGIVFGIEKLENKLI